MLDVTRLYLPSLHYTAVCCLEHGKVLAVLLYSIGIYMSKLHFRVIFRFLHLAFDSFIFRMIGVDFIEGLFGLELG